MFQAVCLKSAPRTPDKRLILLMVIAGGLLGRIGCMKALGGFGTIAELLITKRPAFRPAPRVGRA